MTKKIGVLCLVLLFVAAMSATAFAAGSSLVIGQAKGEIGGKVSVPVSVGGDVGLGSITVLRVVGDSSGNNYTITGGTAVATNQMFDFDVAADGKSAAVTIMAAASGLPAKYTNWKDEVLFNIEVEGKPGVSGTFPITINPPDSMMAGAYYYDDDENILDADLTIQAGSVTFEAAAATPTPAPTAAPTATPAPTAAPTATPAPTAAPSATAAPTAAPSATAAPTAAPSATAAPTATATPTATAAPTAAPSPTPVSEYKLTPSELAWDHAKPSNDGLSTTSNAPFGEFKGVYIGGNLVSPSYYTSEADGNGTKVTLKPEFLNRLGVGTYDLRVQSSSGSATGTLRVSDGTTTPAPTTTATARPTATSTARSGGGNTNSSGSGSGSSPKTGDETNVLTWFVMLIACAATSVAVLLVSRKRKNYN